MSGTLIVDFSRQSDLDDLKSRFDHFCPYGCSLIAPKIEGEPEDARCRGMWVEIPDKIWGKKVASFDYAIWDYWSSQFGFFFCLELIERYKIKRAGWDSIGWCKKIEEFTKCQGFPTERRMAKSHPEFLMFTIDFIDKVCLEFQKAAKRFFNGDGSDLILPHEKRK